MSGRRRPFAQVDVFTDVAYRGNPVAVILDAEGLTDEEMRRIAQWTNLSETTFALPPADPRADYRVRIFTPYLELPFAGHPTIGTCHALVEAGLVGSGERLLQECGAGLVPLRRIDGRLAFAAPPLVRSGPVDEADIVRFAAMVGVERSSVVDAAWVSNGPEWVALDVGSAASVLAARPPGPLDADVGLVGAHPPGSHAAIEIRAFFPANGIAAEDPVTGSLNASVAQWLLGSGQLQAPYVATQGTVLGRAGRVHVSRDDEAIWIGGDAVTCVAGTIEA